MTSSYLLINGLRVHYLHWNLKEDGRRMVLLHGLGSNARLWELVAPHLVRRDLVPLAVDARGHGLTDKPEQGYDLRESIQDLGAFIETANLEHPVLVGHSWGAMLALEYAARFAVGPRAPSGLVLVDGGMIQLDAIPGATWENVAARMAPPDLAGMKLSDFIQRLREGEHGRPSEEAISIRLANFEMREPESGGASQNGQESQEDEALLYPHLTPRHATQILRSMWEYPTYARFRQVRCPVLAVLAQPPEPLSAHEQKDLAATQAGVALAKERIRDLRVHWLPGSLHELPVTHAGELAGLIGDFCASLDA